MNMLGVSRKLGAIAAVLGAVALAAISTPAAAQTGIAGSKHNLGTSNNRATENHLTAGTGEICVFCHTPHASNTSFTSAPLWNKATPPSTTYTMYDTTISSTIDGSVLQPGGASIACLTCHDGTQAMDSFINAPGSGGYDPAGARPAGYTWNSTGRVSATGQLTGTNNVALIGTDLSNDHPIGIQYCGGGVNTGNLTTASCRDTDFNATTNALVNSQRVWWVDSGATGNAGNRDKTDMILYTRDFGPSGSPNIGPSVECGSCHDPHSASNGTFLRISNTGSAVCLACHNK